VITGISFYRRARRPFGPGGEQKELKTIELMFLSVRFCGDGPQGTLLSVNQVCDAVPKISHDLGGGSDILAHSLLDPWLIIIFPCSASSTVKSTASKEMFNTLPGILDNAAPGQTGRFQPSPDCRAPARHAFLFDAEPQSFHQSKTHHVFPRVYDHCSVFTYAEAYQKT
jgi:hypothetical protein